MQICVQIRKKKHAKDTHMTFIPEQRDTCPSVTIPTVSDMTSLMTTSSHSIERDKIFMLVKVVTYHEKVVVVHQEEDNQQDIVKQISHHNPYQHHPLKHIKITKKIKIKVKIINDKEDNDRKAKQLKRIKLQRSQEMHLCLIVGLSLSNITMFAHIQEKTTK